MFKLVSETRSGFQATCLGNHVPAHCSWSVREPLKENVSDEPLWKQTPAKEKQALSPSFGHGELSYCDLTGGLRVVVWFVLVCFVCK